MPIAPEIYAAFEALCVEAATPTTPLAAPEHRLILDTNVALSLFHYHEPALVPLEEALSTGPWQALHNRAILWEFLVVLTRPHFAVPGVSPLATLAKRLQLGYYGFEGEALPTSPLFCKDAEDNKFLQLAWGCQAATLLTRDKDLLKIKKKARQQGLTIARPEDFLHRLKE